MQRHRARLSNSTYGPQRSGPAEWLRRWTIPTIGAVTPVGLIVVNIAAFIVHNLAAFRWIITILAFVSGLMLNSWSALKIYGVVKRRFPDHSWLQEVNQELLIVGVMAVVIAGAFVTALFCYRGLSSEADLPNGTTFITGVVAVAIPIVLQALFRAGERRDAQRDSNTTS